MQKSNKINSGSITGTIHDPGHVFDLSKSVRKFLQKVSILGSATNNKGNSLKDHGNTKDDGDDVNHSMKDDNFYEIVRISVESHVYYQQWRSSSWTTQDIQRIVDIINRHELNALALHGKAVWLLFMMLKHTQEPIPIKQNDALSKLLIQVLFELIFTQTVYNLSIATLRLLRTSYDFSFTDLFIIGEFSYQKSVFFINDFLLTLPCVGVQMRDRYPEMIEDHNFIAVLHFADEAAQCESQSVHFSMELLLALSGCLFGDLEKSNYFLSRTTALFSTGLQIESSSSSSPSTTIQNGVTIDMYKTFGNTIALLRTLATFHPQNREFFGKNQMILDIVLEYLLHRSHYDNEWYEAIAREILIFLNVLSSGMALNKIALINRLPMTALMEVAGYELIGINDALIDLYLTLYEDSLSYCDDELRYMVSDDKDHQGFIQTVLEAIVKKLFSLIKLLPSSTSTNFSDSSNKIANEEPIDSASRSQSDVMIEISFAITCLYKNLLKLEVSLRITSDVTSFLPLKQNILTIFHELLGVNPRKWNLRYIKLTDILVLLYAGADNCWDVPALHAVDQGFVNISHQLVAQFVNLTNDKIFDAKDRNTLNYLAGSDENSTIQSIISRNCDDEYNKSFEISSPNITSTLESSGSMSRSPRQLGLLLSTAGGSHGNLQQIGANPSSIGSPVPDDGQANTSPKIRPNSNFASGCFKVSKEDIQGYMTSFRSLLISLSQHMNFICHMVSDWMLEEALLNYKRLAYLYVATKLFGLSQVSLIIQQSQHMIELLWKNVLSNENSSMMADDKFYLFDLHKRCVQVITLFLHVSNTTGNGDSGRAGEAPSASVSNAFSGAVAFGEWLTKVLEQRPGYLLRTNKKKAKELAAARVLDDDLKREEASGHEGNGGRGSGNSGLEDDDLYGRDTSDMNRSGVDRMSLMGNIVIRPSAFASMLSGGEEDVKDSEGDFRLSSMTGGGDERSLFQFPNHMGVWAEHDLNLDFHYTCVDGLVTLSVIDRTVRRKLVATCSTLIDSLYFLSPMDPVNGKPMMHLVKSMVEFVPKLELSAEEAIVGLIIRNITSPLFNIRTQVCDLIYSIGQESPGFIFRGISRREIEDPLIQIFVHQQEHYELIRNTKKEKERKQKEQQKIEDQNNGDDEKNTMLLVNDEIKPYAMLLLNALKACTVIVHNFNVKPIWLPSPWLYHWQYYQPIISTRDIMTAKGLAIIISVLKHAAIPYRLPYFMYTLSLTSSIMYAFSDGMINPTDKHDILQMKFLKDLLVQNTLPWLPIAIDFIILGKKKKQRGKSITSAPTPVVTATTENSAKGATATSSKKGSSKAANTGTNVVPPLSLPPAPATSSNSGATNDSVLNCRKPIPPAASFVLVDFSDQVKSILVDSQKVTAYLTASSAGNQQTQLNKALALAAAGGASSAAELEVYENMYKIKAIEMLTERTMEAIYAFLCTDDMFPLSTYLQYIHLFQSNSLIASVSYFMTEFKENPIILRRGLDFMKYFSDYQMNLSSMAMHAPPALVNAFNFHKDVFDVQQSFVKVIFVICRTHDDFAKENVIRFNIHIHLVNLLNQLTSNQSHLDLCRMIIQTYLELIFNENHSLLVSNEVSKFVDVLVNILNVVVKDIKVQYEAVRAVATLDFYCPEYVTESSKRQVIFSALKKARKLLINEQSKFQDSGSNHDDAPDPTMVHMNNPVAMAAAGGNSGPSTSGGLSSATNSSKSRIPAVSTNLNGDITKQELDMLLNSKIWTKEKCTIC